MKKMKTHVSTLNRQLKLKKQNGFSLPELIVVLLVVAIILVLALPQVISSRRLFRFSGIQRQIATSLREARQEAMAQRKPVTFRFDNTSKYTVTYGGDFTASYPLDVYSGWLRRFVTFVLPLAFVNYYPALHILDREDPLGLPDWIWLLSPVVALAMAGVARLAWSAGVRRYQSTGS